MSTDLRQIQIGHGTLLFIIHRHDEKEKENYACGGTLIDSQTILTAVHCVWKYKQPLSPQIVLVLLGKLNLSEKETSTQSFQVNTEFFQSFELQSAMSFYE